MTEMEAIKRLEGRYMNHAMAGTTAEAKAENNAIDLAIEALALKVINDNNPTLTEEQIRGMVGKPVWIELVFGNESMYDIVVSIDNGFINYAINGNLIHSISNIEYLGERFNLYAHEPKESKI